MFQLGTSKISDYPRALLALTFHQMHVNFNIWNIYLTMYLINKFHFDIIY